MHRFYRIGQIVIISPVLTQLRFDITKVKPDHVLSDKKMSIFSQIHLK